MGPAVVRTIGAVTVARSDYGICLPVLRAIRAEPDLRLQLFVSGTHLSKEFGLTVRDIEADGFPIAKRVPIPRRSDAPEGIAESMGEGTAAFARAFARQRPDILLVLGDRYEMHAAALAALPFALPVAHIHGGERTEGALDDALRHCITKLSHLHFVAAEAYANRVRQLGEEPWRVTVSGAPALDNLRSLALLAPQELAARFGLRLDGPFLLVTFHPVTLEFERTDEYAAELMAALETAGLPAVFTMPNADTRGRQVRKRIEEFVRAHPASQAVENLGTQGYFSLMARAAAMVGNSSSGIVEAPSFKLPVVNVGSRQGGRLRAANVLDAGSGRAEIAAGIRRALSPDFRAGLASLVNPFGDGRAAERIVAVLKGGELNAALVRKGFHDR
jgi:UDP-hydrolysing UDP-N-acetyl-D-glucosamine 2-epimerase